MSSSPNLTKKYRPYFTLAELSALLECIADKSVSSPQHANLYNYLYKFKRDIEDGLRKPNHSLQPTIEQKLGFDNKEPSYNNSKQISAETLYYRWQTNKLVTPAELAVIQQYRYENDLMTSTEEADYEKSMGISL